MVGYGGNMTEQSWQRTAATVVIAAIAAFGWCFSDLLHKVQTSEIAWNPPTQGDLVMCIVYMALAVGAALKLDIPLLGQGLAQTYRNLIIKE